MPPIPTFLLLSLITLSTSTHLQHRHHHQHPNSLIPAEDSEEIAERLALQHSERVAQAASCSLPRPQVVHVSDHYPGRYYLPHCTLLHRCGRHAGCCGTDRLRCVAEAKEKVLLSFYSVRIAGHGLPPEKRVEKLAFTNHTKCGCMPVERVAKHDL